ncbi:MAG TPA: NAD-dependent epimerase/dehydratase family protein [Opitutaceae bacterium]|nr:NAD-dependent epimerase/dehydratase family protein [Opitutaceae bacterium]
MTYLHSATRHSVLITGGAGFIGTNLAHRLLSGGNAVIILDNLARPGVGRNLQWLRTQHRDRLAVVVADIRDEKAVAGAVRQAGQVFHFATQVAVTTSLADPVADFEANARGTLTLLEAVRRAGRSVPLLFTSTNKVYGDLNDIALAGGDSRYAPPDGSPFRDGVNERRAVASQSPNGCAKGAAEQYVLDYARTYGLPATVFRMSCIYGPHQCGNEDQGWVAHFLLRAMQNRPITICGDGRQVRDVLFIDDLIDAMIFAQANVEAVRGRAFNVGGGPQNTISLLELTAMIAALQGELPRVVFSDWRAADQRWYVSDTRAIGAATGWSPRVGVGEGVRRLHRWLIDTRMTEEMEPAADAEALLDVEPLTYFAKDA